MNNEAHKTAFYKLKRFHEARADMFASTKGIDYAQGGLEFSNELYKRYGDQAGKAPTHPKNSERVTAHTTFVTLHKVQQSYA